MCEKRGDKRGGGEEQQGEKGELVKGWEERKSCRGWRRWRGIGQVGGRNEEDVGERQEEEESKERR